MKVIFTIGCIFMHFGAVVYAQQTQATDSLESTSEIKVLEEVIVTDSRVPLKRSQSGKPVIKIKEKEIAQFQGLGLSALLKQYAGIEIIGSQAYAGQNKTVSLRGGRNRQVVLLVDGIRISDPSRIDNDFDLNYFTLDQIASIEIVKGASSTLYGSSAATGVINITTKKNSKGFQVQLHNAIGTNRAQKGADAPAYFQQHLQLSQGTESVQANVYLSHQRQEGMSAVLGTENDPYSQLNFGGSLFTKPSEAMDFTLQFEHAKINSSYDNSFPLEDAPYQFLTTQDRVSFASNYAYSKGTLALRLGHQSVSRDFQSDYPFSTQANNTQLDLFNTYTIGKRLYSVIGGLFQRNTAAYDENQNATQWDLYANFVALFSDRFRVNVGSRWNHHNAYGSYLTYQINPSFQLIQKENKALKWMGSIGTAFISPSLYQLYDPYSGNPDLQPEQSKSYETGFEYTSSKWSTSILYFKRNENPSLVYDLNTYRYQNSTVEANYFGSEFQASGRLTPKLSLNQQITLTETEGGDLRNLPCISAQTLAVYQLATEWNLSGRWQMVGKRLNLNQIKELDPYQLLHLSIQKTWKQHPLVAYLHLTNLLNTSYVELEGYTSRGRNLVLGIQYRFP
ncbi:MAG: TonB-dependent receptor [Bacteroidetes bacterium]|nr:TonB-dependent receptor [Bacteroidota bacterium]MDA0922144.1 TonB-dependent receptor [Bacteroidota bacterium]MDA1287953.1 TonB-dependent receptor [Bacteroidota bacterium]